MFVDNNIGSVGAEYIKEALYVNSTLLELDLFGKMPKLWNGSFIFFSFLKLDNPIGSGGKALSQSIQFNQSLRVLNLSRMFFCRNFLNWRNNLETNLGSNGVKNIADSLKWNQSLTSLKLASNNAGNIGGPAIAETLKMNQTLRALDLKDNHLEPNEIYLISGALKMNYSLETLSLNGSNTREKKER